jgi:hypothetical protein
MSIDAIPTRPLVDFRAALCAVSRTFAIEALCAGETAQIAREALKMAGKLAQRASPLQPLFMFWFVICLPVFRADSIPALFARLVEGLRGRVGGLPRRVVSDGALAHARRRLGTRAVRSFMRAIGRRACTPSFHGLRVKAIDGVRLDLPDTPANVRVFGRPGSHRGPSAYAQLLVVVLLDLVERVVLDAKISSYKGSERAGATRLFRSIGEGDVVLLDRGFISWIFFRALRATGAHFLARVPAGVRLDPIGGRKAKSTGDYQALIKCRVPLEPGEAPLKRKGRPSKTKEVEMVARVVDYHAPGFRRVRLVTSLVDPSITPEELIALYHRRWDIELAFDEAKTVQAAAANGTLQTQLRSKTPRGVLQETYALLASYSLIRETIARAAAESGFPAEEVGFTDALRVIHASIVRMSGARSEDLPRLHRQMLQDIATCRLDRPRRRRRYPRVMKRKIGKYALKRRCHRALRPVDPVAAFRARHPRPVAT